MPTIAKGLSGHPTMVTHVAGQMALPALAEIPTVPPIGGVTGAFVIREDAIRAARARVSGLRALRAAARDLHRESLPPFESRVVQVTYVVGPRGVSAVVEWRSPRLGRAGVLHRLAGPLRVQPAHVRGVGPVVALRTLNEALADALSDPLT